MNQTNTVSAPRKKTYEITMTTALMAAVTCILAPLSIPDRSGSDLIYQSCHLPVPFYLLGWKKEPSAI